MILFFKSRSVELCPVFPTSAQQKIQEDTTQENLTAPSFQNVGVLLLGTN